MISLVLWSIAPIFNAIMDLVENENFTSSIFYKKVRSEYIETLQDYRIFKWNIWWSKRDSWKTTKKILGYRPDAWHLSKTIMVVLGILSAVIGIYIEGPFFHLFNDNKWINAAFEVVVRGLWWNAIFSLFYHILFRRKTWGK